MTSSRPDADAVDNEVLLMTSLASGDHEGAMAELYDRYASRLYGLGITLLRDRGLAEELVQESFVRLWRSAPRYDAERGSPATYLFTIARRAAVDLLRRRSSRPLAQLDDAELAAIPEIGASHDVELAFGIREALDTLSEPHRAVLVLHYDHGLTQTQIADRLEIPLGTVKTRTYHGLKALRRSLEERAILV